MDTRTVTVEFAGKSYTYEVGDCTTCHRTSVRHYSPGRCYWCTERSP